MPSMTAAFQEAFAPTALSDDRIDRLAELMGSVTRMDQRNGSFCTMTDNGNALWVSDYYCAHCGPIHGGGDGEGDCIHKRALRMSWEAELALRDQEQLDDYAEMQDLVAFAGGR